MRYEINFSQKHLFEKQGYIEFESFLKSDQILKLRELLESTSPAFKGRDLFRHNPAITASLHLSKMGQIAAPLFGEKFLRIAFTQYPPLFTVNASLQDVSSVTRVCGGAFLALVSSDIDSFLIPKTAGSLTFFKPDLSVDFSLLNFPLLLIAFSNEKARYKFQDNDPKTHLLKKMGYAFGDLLTIETHPFIYKP